MNLYYIIEEVGYSFLFLLLVFIPMERVFPAKLGQPFFRPDWIVDFCFFLGNYVVWSGLVLLCLDYFQVWIDSIVSWEFREVIQTQPWWLQVVEVVLLSDFLIYWGHRFQHKYEFLWRFHKVHHAAEHLDWLAAHREHPIDSIITIGIINLPAIVFGFPLESIAGLIAFRGIWAIYIHSNVRMPIGHLRILIGAPELHHWHHSLEKNAGNYANISPIMDVIFGTYLCPDKEPDRLGIEEEFPRNYVGQLILPVLPAFVTKKLIHVKFLQKSKRG